MYNNIDFNNKTILITGGAGFIGSYLAFYFQNNYPKSSIIIFDLFRNDKTFPNGNPISFGHYKNLLGFNGSIVCGDITNAKDLELLSNFKIDFIFHQAAISDTRVYDQSIIMGTNINSFYSFLTLAKKNGAALIYASSAATYGSLASPQTVGLERPENPYGYSKYAMDQIALKFIERNPELNIVGLRFFNVYGPREYFKAKTSSMVIQLGHQILSGRKPRLFKNSDRILRDFIYIEDVIQGIVKACKPGINGVYNIGSGVSRSFQEVSDILQKELGTDLGTEYFENPYTDYQTQTQANIESSKINLNFKPRFSLEDGIKSYIPEIKITHKVNIS